MAVFNAEMFNRLKWRRFSVIAIFMAIGFVAVIARLAHLQLFKG